MDFDDAVATARAAWAAETGRLVVGDVGPGYSDAEAADLLTIWCVRRRRCRCCRLLPMLTLMPPPWPCATASMPPHSPTLLSALPPFPLSFDLGPFFVCARRYSSLYRAAKFPRTMWEADQETGLDVHWSPYTGATEPGVFSSDQGFW